MKLQVNKNDLNAYIEKVVDEFSHDMKNLVSEHAQFEKLLKRIIESSVNEYQNSNSLDLILNKSDTTDKDDLFICSNNENCYKFMSCDLSDLSNIKIMNDEGHTIENFKFNLDAETRMILLSSQEEVVEFDNFLERCIKCNRDAFIALNTLNPEQISQLTSVKIEELDEKSNSL